MDVTELIISLVYNDKGKVIGEKYHGELIRCKDCKWGRESCGNIECHVDLNIPSEYHGYDWYCPNGERKEHETD